MQRVDKYLTDNGYFESRNRAIDAIKRGKVFIDGKRAKPSTKCNSDSKIDIDVEKFYVSRASKKLELFLDEYPLELMGKKALDIGSSTGGFVQILLEKGVKSVVAVDVGSNQLSENLKSDKKVKNFENCDIRNFDCDKVFDIITCDVSFISVLNIIKDIDRFAKDKIIILFKPQFEVGREAKRDKTGVVIDEDAINVAMQRVEKAAEKPGWKMIGKSRSKLKGKEGNVEWFYLFEK